MKVTSIDSKVPVQADEGLEEALPLSAAQRRLWFVQGLDAESSAYTIPFIFDLEGPLDAALLESSLRQVVARHESLRTVFDEVEGEPMQIFRPEPDFLFETEDLTHLDPGDRDASVRAAIVRESHRTFDLGRGPLLVSRLLRLGASESFGSKPRERFVWLLTVHHIVFDGSSLPVLIGELGELYQAAVEGRRPDLPELPLQYADFAAWLEEEIVAPRIEEDLAFWRAELAECPSILRLPTDHPRPRLQTFAGDVLKAPLSSATIEGVREVSRASGATEFMTYLGLWQAFLSRLTGEDRLLVGVPIAGRDRSESEGLIGMLVNSLIFRADVTGDPSVGDFLHRTRTVCLRAFAHQEIPFDLLVEGLRPERHASFSPLAQVAFTMDSFSELTPELVPGISLRCREFELKSSKVDLTLMVRTTGEGPGLVLEYNTDLFDTATAERWLRSFERFLCSALADPATRISELPMLGEAEQALVCGEWAEVVTPYPRDAGLDELFSRQVAARPDAVALCAGATGRQQVTFGALDRRADRLARRLTEAGVERGDRVALLLDRSAELVASVLGIVRAGGAYVPLDASYPEERLRTMLEDAGCRVVVAGPQTADVLPDLPDGTVAMVGGEDGATPAPAGDGHRVPTGGDDLAYVVYTSGSTGRPKGVEIPQRGVVRLVLENDHTDTGPETTVVHMSSVSFDAATMEMWGPLLTGGRMVVHRQGPTTPDELADVLARQRATTLFLTTAFFNQVVEQAPAALAGLSQVNTGGEQASPEHFGRALEAVPGLRLRNLYGPTENSSYSTHHLVCRAPDGTSPVPIGRPIARSSAYVVDARLRPAPTGVIGELLVGGDGLARGYAGRPALTAERFVPDPFGGTSSATGGGGRLYRTGDLVRWLADGALEFVGRNDGQVKVRGFRIEPGEIELALAGHPRVAEALVTVSEARGSRELVAYVVPAQGDDGAGLDAGELRGHLLGRLPEFMVPQAFVVLEGFPLTANGKVDRRALPEPECRLDGGESGRVAPRTPLEEEIAGIWEDVLGVEGVGVYDDFFELGGHSLLATRVLARIHDDFGIRLPLQAVFEGPTVEDLTRVMGERLLAGVSASEPPA